MFGAQVSAMQRIVLCSVLPHGTTLLVVLPIQQAQVKVDHSRYLYIPALRGLPMRPSIDEDGGFQVPKRIVQAVQAVRGDDVRVIIPPRPGG